MYFFYCIFQYFSSFELIRETHTYYPYINIFGTQHCSCLEFADWSKTIVDEQKNMWMIEWMFEINEGVNGWMKEWLSHTFLRIFYPSWFLILLFPLPHVKPAWQKTSITRYRLTMQKQRVKQVNDKQRFSTNFMPSFQPNQPSSEPQACMKKHTI